MGVSEVALPKNGDIWREVDPRFERFVRIEAIYSGRRGYQIRTVTQTEGKWSPAPRSRLSYADAERFNGKRSGYEFHESARP